MNERDDPLRLGAGALVFAALFSLACAFAVGLQEPWSARGALIRFLAIIPTFAFAIGSWLLFNSLWHTLRRHAGRVVKASALPAVPQSGLGPAPKVSGISRSV